MTSPLRRSPPPSVSAYLPALLWALLVGVALLVPLSPSAGGMRLPPYADKLAHFALFAVTAILAGRALRALDPTSRIRPPWGPALGGAGVATVYGALLEIGQELTATRAAEAADLAADGVGAFCGAAAWLVLLALLVPRSRRAVAFGSGD